MTPLQGMLFSNSSMGCQSACGWQSQAKLADCETNSSDGQSKPCMNALLTAWLSPLQGLKGSRSKSPDLKANSKLQKQGLDTVVQVCPPEEGAQVILFRKVCRAAGAHFPADIC